MGVANITKKIKALTIMMHDTENDIEKIILNESINIIESQQAQINQLKADSLGMARWISSFDYIETDQTYRDIQQIIKEYANKA